MAWQFGVNVEGERCSATISGRALCISFDDYREDPTYIDPAAELEWLNAEAEATMDLKDVARCALDTMPDAACSAIANALGLKLHVVVGLSNGRHNKAKRTGVSRGIELSEVTREELILNYQSQMGSVY